MFAATCNAYPVCRWPWRRLWLALIMSTLAHYLIVEGWPPTGGVPLAPSANLQLHAQLELPAAPPAVPVIASGEQNVKPIPAQPAAPVAPATQPAVSAIVPQPGPSAGAAMPDPRIFPARELDRYPVPLTPLELRAGTNPAGIVRLWATIDAAGNVVDVDLVAGDAPAALALMARQLLLAARFEPGFKDERPVKCRILLELRYGS